MVVVSERRGRAGELCSIVPGVQQWAVYTVNVTVQQYGLEWGERVHCPQMWPVYAVQTTVQQCGLMFENKVQCSAVGVKKEGVIFWQCFVTSLQYVRGINSAV